MYRCGSLVSRLSQPTSRAAECVRARTGNAGQKSRGYGNLPQKQPTMNDLPVPQGSWAQRHERIQRRYNLTLAAGLASAGFTFFVAKQSGLIKFGWGPGQPKFAAPEPAAAAEEEEAAPVEEEEAPAVEEAPVEAVEAPIEEAVAAEEGSS